jgi:hypothetical protein
MAAIASANATGKTAIEVVSTAASSLGNEALLFR